MFTAFNYKKIAAFIFLTGMASLFAQGNEVSQTYVPIEPRANAEPVNTVDNSVAAPQNYNQNYNGNPQPYNGNPQPAPQTNPQPVVNQAPAAQNYDNQANVNNQGYNVQNNYGNQGYVQGNPNPQQPYNNPQPYNNAQPYNNVQGNQQVYGNVEYAQNNSVNGTPQNYGAQPENVNSSPKEEKPSRVDKTLQSMNFALPIEKETWKVGSSRLEWNSIGYEFSWTRYNVEKSGYSSVFGLTIGFLTGDVKDRVDLDGLDVNMKFGWGMAPISNDLVLALHFICGFDLKMLEGDYVVKENNGSLQETVPYTYEATYVDAMVGGDVIVAYNISDSFGVIAGVDVTTNVFGIGSFSMESNVEYIDDDSIKLSYLFSGINIVPHVGMFFMF
jgi:hypothetical protein